MKKMAKTIFVKTLLLIFFLNISGLASAQETDTLQVQPQKISVVTKNDGTEYIGIIISMDEREVLIETKELGRLYIPKHEIESIHELTAADIKTGTVTGTNFFSSRYFLTTNGLRMRKDDSYALLNYYGPEIEYCVTNGFTLGGMTTWLAMPIIASMKTSFSLSKDFHMGFGLLAGTLGWANWKYGGVLPYGVLTLGNEKNNLSVSGGYGALWGEDISGGAPLLAIGCIFKLTEKVYFVGDSFIYLKGDNNFAILVPGIRVSRKVDRAFQIGLAAVRAEGETIPVPVPIISWFIKL